MGPLSDIEIRARGAGMIDPFEPQQVKDGKISYGTSSYGYDIRLADEFKTLAYASEYAPLLDPHHSEPDVWLEQKKPTYIIPPHGFVLGRSFEYIRAPRDIMVICLGKSTYARLGVIVNVTPLEPEWEGYITMEISNTTPAPVRIYAHEGIAQLVFFQAQTVCETSYADRKGKYNFQTGVQIAKL